MPVKGGCPSSLRLPSSCCNASTWEKRLQWFERGRWNSRPVYLTLVSVHFISDPTASDIATWCPYWSRILPLPIHYLFLRSDIVASPSTDNITTATPQHQHCSPKAMAPIEPKDLDEIVRESAYFFDFDTCFYESLHLPIQHNTRFLGTEPTHDSLHKQSSGIRITKILFIRSDPMFGSEENKKNIIDCLNQVRPATLTTFLC
jgi:hypothetical protein